MAIAQPAAATGPELPPELKRALSRVTEISALPEITTRIMDVVEDPRATAHDMHEIVKNDPALAAKILKVVNSAFYGLPAQIASLDRAIVMLGLSAVKNIALAASLSRLFKPEPISEHFQPRDLWTHCIAVGVCARLLSAKTTGKNYSEEAFVAGLVHDMGLLVTHQLFADKLKEVAEECYQTPQDFCAVEARIIGASHQAFGAALAAKWKFPPGLRNAITYHHDPSSLKPEFRKLPTLIYVADTVCCQERHGFYLTGQTQELTPSVLEIIGVSAAQLDEVVAELPETIEEAQSIFSDS